MHYVKNAEEKDIENAKGRNHMDFCLSLQEFICGKKKGDQLMSAFDISIW